MEEANGWIPVDPDYCVYVNFETMQIAYRRTPTGIVKDNLHYLNNRWYYQVLGDIINLMHPIADTVSRQISAKYHEWENKIIAEEIFDER